MGDSLLIKYLLPLFPRFHRWLVLSCFFLWWKALSSRFSVISYIMPREEKKEVIVFLRIYWFNSPNRIAWSPSSFHLVICSQRSSKKDFLGKILCPSGRNRPGVGCIQRCFLLWGKAALDGNMLLHGVCQIHDLVGPAVSNFQNLQD